MAAKTPTMAPTVFQAYTRPIDRSPWPARSKVTVKSGRVVPAKKAAGSMMAMAMLAVPKLKSV